MNAEAKRVCPFCAETIQAAAKLCPRCRQWVSLRSFRHPLIATCSIGVPFIAIFIVIGIWCERNLGRLYNPPPYYTAFPDPLRIIESRMNWVATGKEPRIYVTGILTNQSPIAWKDVEFECRFYDTNGVMVDAYNGRGYLTIQPNDDSAFRVSVMPSRPAQDYASHKLSVSTARNDKALF